MRLSARAVKLRILVSATACAGTLCSTTSFGVRTTLQRTASVLRSTAQLLVSCTDSSWNDPSCPQYCVFNNHSETGGVGDIRQCSNENFSWICGMDSTDCSNNFTLPYGYVDDKGNSSLNNILADGSVSDATTATSTVMVTVTATANSITGPGTPAGSTVSSSCTDT